MAKLIGIDIQQRYVRAALLATSYRKTSLVALSEVSRASFGTLEEAVQACVISMASQADSVAVAVDGDVAFIRRLELPRTAEKQLAEVIPFELEAQVPVELDQLVYDWVKLPRRGESIEILAAAVRVEHVRERIALVSRAISREAERVGAGPLPLANLGSVIADLRGAEPVAILELGDERSELLVMSHGHPTFARTLTIGIAGLPESAPELAARLRQTMTAAATQLGDAPTVVFLTGDGAAASGAIAYLQAELRSPVALLPDPELDGITSEQAASLPRFSRALGLALGLRGRARDLDLRRGALSYQRGFAFIKERARVLGSLGAAILLSFFFATWAELRSLSHEHDALAKALAALSKDALHDESEDPDHVREALETAAARAETDPMPHIDGFDVMVELSKAVPTSITHDVEELDVTREHVKLRGIVGSAAEAQTIADGLKKNRCFPDVKITKVSQVVNETRQKYVLEGETFCPEDAAARKKAEAESAGKQP